MFVKLENLKKGDEIMIAQGANFVCAKLLREPTLRFVKDKSGTKVQVTRSWGSHKGEPIYSAIRCIVKAKEVTLPARYGNLPRVVMEYDNTLENYTHEKSINLNFRDIWLLES